METTKVLWVTEPCCNHFKAYPALRKQGRKPRWCFLRFSLAQTLPDDRFLRCNGSQSRNPRVSMWGLQLCDWENAQLFMLFTTDLHPLLSKSPVPLNLLSSSVPFLTRKIEAAVRNRQGSLKFICTLLSPTWKHFL